MSIGYIQLPPDSTGKKLRAVYHSDYGDYAEVMYSKPIEAVNPMYVAVVVNSAVSSNKYHLVLVNDSMYYLRVHHVKVAARETGTVAGFILSYELRRISGSVSGGTSVAISKLDPRSADLPSGVSALNNPTVSATSNELLYVFAVDPEETGGNAESRYDLPYPIGVPPNQALALQQYSMTGVAAVDVVFVFSVELVNI
jgi:hypothetical protein